MNKKVLLIIIIILFIIAIALIGIKLNIKKNSENNSNNNVNKVIEYLSLDSFNTVEEIKTKGYIDEDSALKIAAIESKKIAKVYGGSIADVKTELKEGKIHYGKEIPMEHNWCYNDIIFATGEETCKYWDITICYRDDTAHYTFTRYEIKYYTGEITHITEMDLDIN